MMLDIHGKRIKLMSKFSIGQKGSLHLETDACNWSKITLLLGCTEQRNVTVKMMMVHLSVKAANEVPIDHPEQADRRMDR